MRAEELRIGNLITDIWASEGSAFEVVSLSGKHTIVKYGAKFSAKIENLRPVPITEDWLKRFGFKHAYSSFHDGIFIYVQNGFRIVHQNEAWWLDGEFEFKQKPIEFVHQIQNLYHCLIGEDLKLN